MHVCCCCLCHPLLVDLQVTEQAWVVHPSLGQKPGLAAVYDYWLGDALGPCSPAVSAAEVAAAAAPAPELAHVVPAAVPAAAALAAVAAALAAATPAVQQQLDCQAAVGWMLVHCLQMAHTQVRHQA